MPDDLSLPSETTIPTNLRLLLLLEAVARSGGPVTLQEVNATLGLPKPTIHRLFQTLEAEGFIQRDIDGRSFEAGRRLSRLAANVLSSNGARAARLAILRRLADDIGETCNIATPGRDAMIYVDRVETKWPLRIQLDIGSTVPFHCTASGKLYLSTLTPRQLEKLLGAGKAVAHGPKSLTDPKALRDEIAGIRERGYSTDEEEFMPGMIAIAAPIHDDQGRLASTLSIHAPIQRIPAGGLTDWLPRLRAAAVELSKLLTAD